jgi:putative heme-binding domain-containing protein
MRGILIGLILIGGVPLPAEDPVAEGRKIYNQTCTGCHGLDGTVGDRGPALAGNRRFVRRTERELFEAIRDGIPETLMPPTGLPDEVVKKIVAFIRSLRATAYDGPVKGDVARGERIFWGRGQCGACHMIRGKGGILGPELSNAGGQRTLSYLREALTKAKPRPPRGYQPVRLTTADGQTLTGILKNEDNFSLQLLDSAQKLRMFAREELREMHYEDRSLMPSDYDKKLAAEELEDLLAFLSRQARRETP